MKTETTESSTEGSNVSDPTETQQGTGLPAHWANPKTASSKAEDEKGQASDSEPDEEQSEEQVTEGESEEESTEASTEDEDGGEEPTGKGKGIAKKFKRVTAEKTRLKQANDALQARLDSIEAKLNGKTPEKKEDQTQGFTFDKAKPKLDDFDTNAEHAEALAEWKFEQLRAKEKFEQAQTENKTKADKLFGGFFDRAKAVEKELGLEPGEWNEAVRSEDFKVSAPAAEALAELDILGNKIAWQIASDEDVLEKFNNMTVGQQLKFIGKLEAKAEAASEATSKKGGNGFNKVTTKAKAPGSSIKGGKAGSGPQVSGKMSFAELAAKNPVKSQAEFKDLDRRLRSA